MTTFNAEYFLSKFEAIPEEMWIIKDFTNVDCTKHCAVGHCANWKNGVGTSTSETKPLCRLFDLIKEYPTRVNDGESIHYPQPTPKLRILAALREIQEKGG